MRLFAVLRERAGASEITLELSEGACVGDVLAGLGELTDGLSVVLAVNREYADAGQVLRAGDELALIPPVSGGAAQEDSGGAGGAPHVVIRSEPLSAEPLLALVSDPRAGAIVSFSGVTREVDHLDYEAYAEMAQPLIEAIVAAAIARHGLCAAAAEHRIGRVQLGAPSVIVAVSAPHRDAAFAGAREIIDEIKARAPIFKREQGQWQTGTPPA